MTGAQTKFEAGRDLIARLERARSASDDLFGIVKTAALYDRPIPERHRIVFYIGHLEAFDWNLFSGQNSSLKRFNPEFDRLFAFGIDPMGGGLPADQPSDWPSLGEVRRYSNQVRQELAGYLERRLHRAEPQSDESSTSIDILLNVAIEHRLMHAETLAYMFHQLPLDRKITVASAPTSASSVVAHRPLAHRPITHRMVAIPAGIATIGLPRRTESAFGWDNEFELVSVQVPAFEIDAYPATNADFLKFVGDGGYERRELWTGPGWEWISSQGVRHPGFWLERDGSWFCRTMFAEVSLPGEWPVYVSHAEAAAYARWAGKSLPTEAQWHRAAYADGGDRERDYPWGCAAPDPAFGNFDFSRWDPSPVNAHPAGRSAFSVSDLVGNGWEWTSTVFGPLPNFEPFPFYRGYSANFFDGQHYVMKGGSARTAACMLRRSFRNWFQSHYPYVYATFRCVAN